jgi:hypothetical protein
MVAFVALAAVAAGALPLLVYSTSLAAFGLAHVASELWYVDHRFGRRVRMELVVGAAALLAAVVVVRVLILTRVVAPSSGLTTELLLVCALGALALPALFRSGARALAIGVVVVGGLACGTLLAPALTLTFLAVAHNATPAGFLVERAAPRDRVRVAGWCVLVFAAVPLLVASGVVGEALHALGVIDRSHARDVSLLPTGSLREHLHVYVPRAWHGAAAAPDWFAGVVCAQVLHYGAVIGVLPRTVDDNDVARAPWPPVRWFIMAVLVLGVGLFVHFAVAFAEARAIYGLAAGVHAWVEVPVLLLAVTTLSKRA